MNFPHLPSGGTNFGEESSIFAIRGDLDGGKENADFSEVKQFIGLMIANEEFLLPIETVAEIIMIHHMTFVPGAPRFVEGVINLRGRILPAINLRQVLGHATVAPTIASRIIIANFQGHLAGLLVDGITYVVSLNPDEVQASGIGQKGRGAEFITAIAKRSGKVNGVLDVEKLFFTVGGSKFNVAESEETEAG